MAILVTGGAGYIGSHTVLSLLEKGYDVVVLDNYSNSLVSSLDRVKEITGCNIFIYNGDVRNKMLLNDIFKNHSISDVIHFAGLKSVSESIKYPSQYYNNNVMGSLILIDKMLEFKIPHLIFSSSATVYGEPEKIPLTESCRIGGTTNPYGTTKLMVERMLADITHANPEFRTTILRYFNPVGAHPSGMIGEDPNGMPNNIMPFICQVATGKREQLTIFGNDYPTPDGTGIRDFIHVLDLADGHIAALQHRCEGTNCKVYNLGTGRGYSVLELVNAFKQSNQIDIPYTFSSRRAGDIAECWSDSTKAHVELGWKAKRGLNDMVKDSWCWQKNNPDGYVNK